MPGPQVIGTSIRDQKVEELKPQFTVGDQVLKFTGDYHLTGEVRAVFLTKKGRIRYVVEHEAGFLHIYSAANIKLLET